MASSFIDVNISGTVTAVTPSNRDNSTKVATTEYVNNNCVTKYYYIFSRPGDTNTTVYPSGFNSSSGEFSGNGLQFDPTYFTPQSNTDKLVTVNLSMFSNNGSTVYVYLRLMDINATIYHTNTWVFYIGKWTHTHNGTNYIIPKSVFADNSLTTKSVKIRIYITTVEGHTIYVNGGDYMDICLIDNPF
jgi:hypothetical protein